MWAQPSATPTASDPPHTAEQQFFPPLPPTKRSRLSRIPLSQTYRKPSSILESAEGNIISISILNFFAYSFNLSINFITSKNIHITKKRPLTTALLFARNLDPYFGSTHPDPDQFVLYNA